MTERIDAHVHLWSDLSRYSWGTHVLDRPFELPDLEAHLDANGMDRAVFVQTLHDTIENEEILDLAATTTRLAGVVGWLDLADPAIGDDIARTSERRGGHRFAGVRHLPFHDPDPAWLVRPDVQRGVGALAAADLTLDVLLVAGAFASTEATARAHPTLRVVVDHIGHHAIEPGEEPTWRAGMEALAAVPNVACKLSDLTAVIRSRDGDVADVRDDVHRLIEWFGPDRILYASNWPVCLLNGTYEDTVTALEACIAGSAAERERLFGGNARRWYGIADD